MDKEEGYKKHLDIFMKENNIRELTSDAKTIFKAGFYSGILYYLESK